MLQFRHLIALTTRHYRPLQRKYLAIRWKSVQERKPSGEVLQKNVFDGVLTLTLNRPKQRNALNQALLTSLKTELEGAAESPREIRAVILQGGGGTGVFSSGHDLEEIQSMTESERAALFSLSSEVMQLLPQIPQPTIGAVNGLATAAGCQLVAACDLVVAHPGSRYATPGATTIGLFCHTPAVQLVRCIGTKRALEMLYTGRTITGPQAMDYGLVTQLAANPQREAAKLAKMIASQSSCAMQLGKESFYNQLAATDLREAYIISSAAMVKNLSTVDARNGIQAFLEKKEAPDWQHE